MGDLGIAGDFVGSFALIWIWCSHSVVVGSPLELPRCGGSCGRAKALRSGAGCDKACRYCIHLGASPWTSSCRPTLRVKPFLASADAAAVTLCVVTLLGASLVRVGLPLARWWVSCASSRLLARGV